MAQARTVSKSQIDRPLGKILHIVDGEAITHPSQPFVGKNARVVLDTLEEIGVLGDPFGPADRPFQPIILKNPDNTSVVGKFAFAQLRSSGGNRKKKFRGKRPQSQKSKNK